MGVIEYLDVNESDSSFMAKFDTIFKHDENVKYTHLNAILLRKIFR